MVNGHSITALSPYGTNFQRTLNVVHQSITEFEISSRFLTKMFNCISAKHGIILDLLSIGYVTIFNKDETPSKTLKARLASINMRDDVSYMSRVSYPVFFFIFSNFQLAFETLETKFTILNNN